MRFMIFLMAFLAVAPSHSRVGDEACERWAIFDESRRFGEGEIRRDASLKKDWHCSSGPSGGNRFWSCSRKIQSCIAWGPSPSKVLAKEVGAEIGKNVAESLTQVNTNMHENYSQDVFTMLNDLGDHISNLSKALISALSGRN